MPLEADCESDQTDHDMFGLAESLFVGLLVTGNEEMTAVLAASTFDGILLLALWDSVYGTVIVTDLPTPQASGTVVTAVVIAGLLGTGVSVHPQCVVVIVVVFVSHPVGHGTTYVVVKVTLTTDGSSQFDHV